MIQERTHRYGENVHLLQSPSLEGWLAQLCSPATFQPQINHLVQRLYSHLIRYVVDKELETESFKIPTRMTTSQPEAMLSGLRISNQNRAIVVNLARAGTFPSHICYDALHDFLLPENIRQDHIFASRITSKDHQVTGTEFGASKIGGGQENSYVIFPDPMGATGNTLVTALDHYKKNVPSKAKQYLALHLIVTPEYLKKVTTHHPDLKIYALRLDRGLSSKEVLESPLGSNWNQEKGLNSHDYIIPGGGGFGEIMNNSFV